MLQYTVPVPVGLPILKTYWYLTHTKLRSLGYIKKFLIIYFLSNYLFFNCLFFFYPEKHSTRDSRTAKQRGVTVYKALPVFTSFKFLYYYVAYLLVKLKTTNLLSKAQHF